MRGEPMTAFDEHGIAKLVRSVTVFGELGINSPQHHLVEKGAQQHVVAGAGLVRAGEDDIDDPEFCPRCDPFGRDAVSGT